MDIQKLSIDEALITMLFNQDDVDATNAIPLLRHAQSVIVDYAGGRVEALSTIRTVEEVDDIITMVTMNGRFDIFRDDI